MAEMLRETNSAAETRALGEELSSSLRPGDVVVLEGELGAGKTFFSKYLVKTLGGAEEVTSPTFNLMNIYEGICPIYHFDLYRLENAEDLFDIGFLEYAESEEGVCLIEWADKFKNEMPENIVEVAFEIIDENKRKITFSGQGEKAEELLAELKEGGIV